MNIIKTIIQTNGKYISVKSARSSKSKNLQLLLQIAWEPLFILT